MQNKCLKTGTALFWRTSVLVYSYFLAHAAGSGGCDNDITGDIGKNVSFCNICDGDRACGRYVAETLQCSLSTKCRRNAPIVCRSLNKVGGGPPVESQTRSVQFSQLFTQKSFVSFIFLYNNYKFWDLQFCRESVTSLILCKIAHNTIRIFRCKNSPSLNEKLTLAWAGATFYKQPRHLQHLQFNSIQLFNRKKTYIENCCCCC